MVVVIWLTSWWWLLFGWPFGGRCCLVDQLVVVVESHFDVNIYFDKCLVRGLFFVVKNNIEYLACWR